MQPNMPSPSTQALITAAQLNDGAAAQAALDQGADLSWQRYTAFNQAAGRGHVAMVRILLPHVPLPKAARALYTAAKADQWAILDVLLEAGVTLLPDHAIHLINRGGVEAVRRLTIEVQPERYEGLLGEAIRQGHADMVQFLLGQRAPGTPTTTELVTALKLGQDALARSLLPAADVAAADQALWAAGNLEALDRLACLVDAPQRDRLVRELGTRHLIQATEIWRCDQRQACLMDRPAAVRRSRPRA